MLRAVELPAHVRGQLYLRSMPGRWGSFADAAREIQERGIRRVVCLVPPHELREKSPDYADAIEARQLPWVHESFPIADYGVPDDREEFWELACTVAAGLQDVERILIHCAAGIGRTGTLALCVLLALGLEIDVARDAVHDAQASPEGLPQDDLVRWAKGRSRGD